LAGIKLLALCAGTYPLHGR